MVDDLERVLRDTRDEQAARWGKPSRCVWPDAKDSGPADGREFDRTVFQPALIAAEINKVIEMRETKQVRAGKGVRTVGTVRRQIERNFRWKDLRHTFASWL